MSASISYEPKKRKNYSVGTMSPNHFMETCERVFGQFPLSLSEKDIPKLEVLSATQDGEGKWQSPWKQLIKAVETHDEIDVYAEY